MKNIIRTRKSNDYHPCFACSHEKLKNSQCHKRKPKVKHIINITKGLDQKAFWVHSALDWPARDERMIPTMRPYSASASAKMRIKIIPTNSFGCCAFALHNTHTNHTPHYNDRTSLSSPTRYKQNTTIWLWHSIKRESLQWQCESKTQSMNLWQRI